MEKYCAIIVLYCIKVAFCAHFSISGELTEENYLRQKFHDYSISERCARWLPNDSIAAKFVEHGVNFADGDTLITTILCAYDFVENACDAKYYVFATNTTTNLCHFCFPEIGMAKFVKRNSSWELQLEDFFIAQGGGGYGTNPDAEIISCGKSKFCTILHGDYFTQDVGYETVSIIIERKGRFDIIFSSCIGGDGEIIVNEQSGATQKFKFTGSVEFLPTQNAEIYDLRITMKGNKPVDTPQGTQIIDVDEQHIYYFDGDMLIERQM